MSAFNKPMGASAKWQVKLARALHPQISQIKQICEISGVAGVSVVVLDHGLRVFEQNIGYRDVANKEPVTSDTVFHVGSLTKAFTGVCINQMRSRGRLQFDDPIHKHLPEARSCDPAVASLATIADLLGHRIGLQKANELWLGADNEELFEEDQIWAVFRNLAPMVPFRSRFSYHNFGWALLGDIVTEVTGQAYHEYLKENILDPLGMDRTFVTKDHGLPDNTSLAYSTLDNGEPYNVPLFSGSSKTLMGPAGGLLSTTNDLAKWCKELMSAWQVQAHGGRCRKYEDVFGDISWLFAPLQILGRPTFRENSYAAGWARTLLPNGVGSLGANPDLVSKMPVLGEGINSPRLALWHQGSLTGATSFIMLLPDTESAVIVLTNTMAPNDAADWIGQLLAETLLDTPTRNDYVALASESADRALKLYSELSVRIEEGKTPGGPPRALDDYIGTYVGFGDLFSIVVRKAENGLEMLLQGRETQKYELHHHHDNTFTWFISWNEQIKRGRFINYQDGIYFVRFRVGHMSGGVVALNWAYEAGLPDGEEFLREVSEGVL
ncbi:beta-lactamase/transpeptidase-like protein [Immersiella caudata]|uniref:Beta-lactamase/transpeptidase-like protein n=1 Tax=Immersiella caudata TaxID=314043 RepID=A0AA39XCI0_9PEZI|nr:beta-lactamase/transpeptidase-like protein [Immersiella caudata]